MVQTFWFWSKSENLTWKSDSDPNLHHFRNSRFNWVFTEFLAFCQERLEENGQRHFMPEHWIKSVKGEKANFEFIWYCKQYLAPSLHFAQIVSSSSDSSSAVRWNMQAWDHAPATPHCVASQSNLQIQIQIQIQTHIEIQIQTHLQIQIQICSHGITHQPPPIVSSACQLYKYKDK